MDYDFNMPTAAQATKILSRVPEDMALRAGRMDWPRGFTEMPIYRLNDAFVGLDGNHKTFPAINFKMLVTWVDEVTGDPDLAQALSVCSEKQNISYVEQCREMRTIIGSRLTQLRKIAGIEIDEPKPPAESQRS